MKATVGDIKAMAVALWNEGYRGDKQGRPIDINKPLIPVVIARKCDVSLSVAAQVNHLIVMWSIGAVPFGEYDKL